MSSKYSFLSSAVRRLLNDMRVMHASPLPTVAAEFASDDNIFEVHCNLFPPSGPFAGLPFHCVFTFPEDYPVHPPSLTISVVIPHPNVYSKSFVCLDMIQSYHSHEPYTGWSSAYSLQPLLLQLQTFLFDEYVPQQHGAAKKNDIDHSKDGTSLADCIKMVREYKCPGCAHHGVQAPFPARPSVRKVKKEAAKATYEHRKAAAASSSASSGSSLQQLPDDVLHEVLDFLPYDDLRLMVNVNTILSDLIRRKRMLERYELICFHTKRNFTEAVLGVGISADFHRGGSDLKTINACMDLISFDAFSHENVRLGVWKDKFTHFLPLYLNDSHGARSMRILESQLSHLAGKPFTPELALNCLVKLMNSVVVNFMHTQPQTISSGEVESISFSSNNSYDDYVVNYKKVVGSNHHASERALQAYVFFHQLLLALTRKYPAIRDIVHSAVARFTSKAEGRRKAQTPDLGEFLILLGLSASLGGKSSWPTVRQTFLSELFARNVMWLLREHEYLGNILDQEVPSTSAACHRLTLSFNAAQTGLRLVAFQVFFLRFMTRAPAATLLNSYNATLGCVADRDVLLLQRHAKLVQRMQHYGHFFELVGIGGSVGTQPLSAYKVLCDAVRDSEKAGYHQQRYIRSNDAMRKCLCKVRCEFATNSFSKLLPPAPTPVIPKADTAAPAAVSPTSSVAAAAATSSTAVSDPAAQVAIALAATSLSAPASVTPEMHQSSNPQLPNLSAVPSAFSPTALSPSSVASQSPQSPQQPIQKRPRVVLPTRTDGEQNIWSVRRPLASAALVAAAAESAAAEESRRSAAAPTSSSARPRSEHVSDGGRGRGRGGFMGRPVREQQHHQARSQARSVHSNIASVASAPAPAAGGRRSFPTVASPPTDRSYRNYFDVLS